MVFYFLAEISLPYSIRRVYFFKTLFWTRVSSNGKSQFLVQLPNNICRYFPKGARLNVLINNQIGWDAPLIAQMIADRFLQQAPQYPIHPMEKG
jgi:hypothetical protein